MFLPLPSLVVTPALTSFVIVAVSMIGITIFLLGKVLPADGRPPLVTQMVIALAVLGGGSLLLLSLLFVFLNPDGTEAWTFVLLAFNFMMMFPAGIWFVGLILFRDRRISATSWFWPATLSVVATGSEALMGVLFAYGAASSGILPVPALAVGLTNLWFFWSMAAVMSALLIWAPLSLVERRALLALTGASVLGPWVIAFPTVGGLAMTTLMAAAFLWLVRSMLKGQVASEEGRLLAALATAFAAMAVAGLAVAATGGAIPAALGFGGVMGVVMGVEAAYLIRRYYQGHMARPLVTRSSDDAETPAPVAVYSGGTGLERHAVDRPLADR